MKRLLKDVIFIVIFILLLGLCSNIFIMKGAGYGSDVWSFYELERDSLDVIFFGSSHSYATFSPKVIKEETGLKSYNFATQQQPLSITYYYIKEALEYQSPDTIVLETRMLTVDDPFMKEGVVRDAVDKMPFSLNKINAINASVENPEDRVSYYLNIIKYHTRYDKLKQEDFFDGPFKDGIDNDGYIALESKADLWIDNAKELKIQKTKAPTEKNLEYFEKIIALAKEKDIRLILVKSPCNLSEKERMNLNWLEAYAKEHQLEFIDYNEKVEELGLVKGDYYDLGHLSGSGSVKTSKHFSKILEQGA